MAMHPVCQQCGRAASTDLDHIMPHRGDVNLFWDPDNMQALCKQCHDAKTANEINR